MHALVIVLAVLAACGDKDPPPVPLQKIDLSNLRKLPQGKFQVLQRFVRDRASMTTRDTWLVYADNVISEIAGDLNNSYRLPRDVRVKVFQCGDANALYLPDTHEIVFCSEFVDHFLRLFGDTTNKELSENITAAIAFFLHEVGHALIGEFELPVFGNEEAAADTYATYLMATSGNADLAERAADMFVRMHDAKAGQPPPTWDVHGLDDQRFFAVICMLYGSDPVRFAAYKSEGILPADRPQQCVEEWATNKKRIVNALQPHHR